MPGSAATSRATGAQHAVNAASPRLRDAVPDTTVATFGEDFADFPDLAWLIEVRDGPRYVYVEVNPALLRWAGVDDAERVVGHTPDELLPPEASTPYIASLDELMVTGGERELTLEYKAAGRDVMFESYLRLLPPESDRPRYVLGVARDVTDHRRRAEETAAAIEQVAGHYDAVRIGVALIDPNGVIKWANAALVDLVQASDGQLVESRLSDLLHPDDAGDVGADFVLGQSEQRLRCADESYVWVRMTSTLVTSVVGGELYTLVQVEDVTPRRLAEEALHEQRDRFMSLASSSPIGIFFTDPEGNLLFSNGRLQDITGLSHDELAGRGWLSVVHPEDAAMVHALVGALAEESELSLPYRLVVSDGQIRWVHARLARLQEGEATTGFAGTVEDITIRVWSEQALTEREAEYRLLANMSSDLISRHDADGTFLYASPASRALIGYEPHELVGMRLVDLVHPDDKHQVQLDNRHLATREQVTITCRVRHAKGQWVWIEASARNLYDEATGERKQVICVTRDITERKRTESLLAHQALHDPLTGLPNRVLLMDRLSQALVNQRSHSNNRIAVLFLDVDSFKMINDSLGHEAGDRLLVAVGNRLSEVAGPLDTVARFGGDEFVLACPEIAGEDDVVAIAEAVNRAIRQPFVGVDASDVFVTVSIGIAIATDPATTPDELIRDADVAMYRAKERGGVRYEIFNEQLRSRIVDRMETTNALHRAIERDELRLFYQPLVEARSRQTVGLEALVRWEHPTRGLVLPGEFIPIAEATGLIANIDEWVLREASRQICEWADAGIEPPYVSVNLSARQLADPNVTISVAKALEDTGVDPSLIVLEVTETTVMDDPTASIARLQELRELGVAIAVDDFGTGYSSLSYLKRLPIDRLKVDKSFVSGLGDQLEDTAIVAAVITLAHTLGLKAVAEGVESEKQYEELRNLDCDIMQGYLFARPQPPEIVAKTLPARSTA